nr:MAG TPA: hypothetical protein [Caudoviricetes sp.]
MTFDKSPSPPKNFTKTLPKQFPVRAVGAPPKNLGLGVDTLTKILHLGL